MADPSPLFAGQDGGPAPLAGRRIGLLTASASRLGGGVFEAVVIHANLLRSAGATVEIFALGDRFSAEDAGRFAPSQVHHSPVVGPRQIGFAPGLVGALLTAKLDCLHLHGIWMYPSRAGARWAQATGKPYLISPHGMLDPWITARGRLKKSVARLVYERAAWRRARALHALTRREADDIRRETGRSDTIVIPNPGPPPQSLTSGSADRPQLCYLGRIHPKKNIGALIEAWASLDETARRDAQLLIAGWGEERHVAELEAQLKTAPASVRFIGAVHGQSKAELLAASRFLILPSFSEGLPMVILEAWAAGTPTIMTQECNLEEGFAVGAALRCGFAGGEIAPVLTQALAMSDDDWTKMSRAGLELAAGPFAPGTIANRWASAYAAMLSLDERKRA